MDLEKLEKEDYMYWGPAALSSLDEDFKQTTNYILIKYIYVLQSKLQLRRLQEKITISSDERLDCKFKKAIEILEKEEKMILMMLGEKDEKVLQVLENLKELQGYYITNDNLPVPDFFYSLDLRDYKYVRPFKKYDNAFINCLLIDYVNCKTIIESLNLDI